MKLKITVLAISLFITNSLYSQKLSGILTDTPIGSGIAIHIGTSDGKLEQELASGGKYLVQGLTLKSTVRDQVQRQLQQNKLYGLASIQAVSSFKKLPYADNLVSLVIIDFSRLKGRASDLKEILRILHPGGVACIKKNGNWEYLKKQRSREMDDWSHYDHGPGGNPVSSDSLVQPVTSLRWYVHPSFTEAQGEREAGPRLINGKLIYALKNYAIKDRVHRNVAPHHLVCRNAYNGVFLWEKEIASDNYTPYRHELIGDDQHIYLKVDEEGPMVALNLETGEEAIRYSEGAQIDALEYENRKIVRGKRHLVARVYKNYLVQAYQSKLYCLDKATGKKLWEYTEGPDTHIAWASVGEEKVYLTVGKGEMPLSMRGTLASLNQSIIALNLKTGQKLWAKEDFKNTFLVRLVYKDGYLPITYFPGEDRKDRRGKPMQGFGHKFGVSAVRASDGEIVWKSKKLQSAGGHYAITFVKDEKAYVACERYFGYDLKTGAMDKGIPQRTFVNSCAETRATPNYILYGMSFANKDHLFSPRAIARSTCDTGVFPANGMIYCTPPKCTCLDVVAGYTATSADPPIQPATKRLFSVQKVSSQKSPKWPADQGWPMYMGNPQRGNWTRSEALPKFESTWQVQVDSHKDSLPAEDWRISEVPGGLLSAPTIKGELLYFAVPNQHRVEARTLKEGQLAWEFTAGAPVDTPPTLYSNLCLFGSNDGWVYALDAKTGDLHWKYLAALNEKTIYVNGHLESPWPVMGSIMVFNHQLWILAGRHSSVDQGIQVHCLEPFTGKKIWQARMFSGSFDHLTPKEIPNYPNHGKVGKYYPRKTHLLVSDGQKLHHYVETLKDKYAEGELIELHPTNGRWGKFLNIRESTWLQPNLMGFQGRRTESIGRFDQQGIRYSNLQAHALVLTDKEIFCAWGKQSKVKNKFGHLTRIPLKENKQLEDHSLWRAKIEHVRRDGKSKTGDFAIQAMIVSGKTLYLAGYEKMKPDSALHAYSIEDGKKIAQWDLPSRPLRNGLAATTGYVMVSCEGGQLLGFKN